MTYVLVHLVGDDASKAAGRLADYLCDARTPVHDARGESPAHAEIADALERGGSSASGVCISHGGSRGIGPAPDRVWATAEQLGEIYRARRIYVYGCETTGPNSLATRAIAAGVAVFVGHDVRIEAPLPSAERRMVVTVAGAAILAFIDGTDDERALQAAIDDAANEVAPYDIPIDFEAVREQRPNLWSQSLLLEKLAMSLRVHRRV